MKRDLAIKSLFACMSMLLMASCSVNKYIPDNEVLYTDGSLKLTSTEKIKDKSALTVELSEVLYPSPNSKFLGRRLGLLYHYRAQKKRPGPLNRFLNKKFGEEPVYLSNVDLPKTEQLIDNRLENNGFFKNNVSSTVLIRKKHAKIQYKASIAKAYQLRTYQVDSSDLPIYKDIRNSMAETLITPGSRFDLNTLKNERTRIDAYLKSLGYYNFNSDFLMFEADTNHYEGKEFDLFIRLKRDTPPKSKIPYRIHSIEIFPKYVLKEDRSTQDTVTVDGIDVIQGDLYFKPELLTYYLLLKKGARYDPFLSKITSQRYSSIGNYKYVNIRHNEMIQTDTTDTVGWLNTKIYLSPMKKRSLRAELQAVSKSNNFAGPSLLGTYANRNLFQGGELLQWSGHIGYETQITGGKNSGLSSTQLGLNVDLIFPRLIPFRLTHKYRYDVPKTVLSLGLEYLERSKLYTLRTFTSTFGYNWNASQYIYHDFNPISINLVNLSNTTSEFDEILEENPFLASSFNQEFIGGLTYNFTYSQLSNPQIHNPIHLITNLDIAGNGLNAISNGTNNAGNETVFGLEYAQYVKSDLDLRFYFNIGKGHQIITRTFAGLGIAYGNSNALPFAKQYYSGGPYSVRAFQIRSLGPGTYTPEQSNSSTSSFFDRTGEIRLEANIEYRFPIISYLKGAWFLDAGNVWLRKENEALPGGQFTADFYNHLGIGTGVGLRVDVQNFVIRGDFAFPLDKPTDTFQFYGKELIFNFAIGYPF